LKIHVDGRTIEGRHLATVIWINIGVAVVSAVLAASLARLFGGRWFVLLSLLDVLLALALAVALYQVRIGRTHGPALCFSLVNWIGPVATTAVMSFAQSIAPLGVLLGTATAIPYLRHSTARRVLTGSVFVAFVIALLARLHPTTILEPHLPRWALKASLVVLVPGCVTLVGFVASRNRQLLEARTTRIATVRSRILTGADRARHALEQDLNDGPVQLLRDVARILDTAIQADQVGPKVLKGALQQLQHASADLRVLAHGLFPPQLATHGLVTALAATGLPLAAESVGNRRFTVEIEAAVYLCCLEAISNANKHAGPSAAPSITLELHRTILAFQIKDAGHGFDPSSIPLNGGLTNIEDRLGAAGGKLRVISSPGNGTTVQGTIDTRLENPRRSASFGEPLHQLRSIHRILHLTTVFSLLAVLALYFLVLATPWLLAMAAVIGATIGSGIVERRLLANGQVDRMIALYSISHWTVGITVTAIAPSTLAFTPALLLLPLLLAIPHLSQPQMHKLTLGAALVAGGLAVLGTRTGAGLEAVAPKWVFDAAVIVFLTAIVTNAALLTTYNHASFDRRATDLQLSLARVANSFDTAKSRLERDLHDGAQQRLVATTVQLRVALHKLDRTPASVRTTIPAVHCELNETIAELHELAQGIFPSLLRDFGVTAALQDIAARSTMPITVTDSGIGRHTLEIETGLYFCCLEALTNASKHAGPRASIRVSLTTTNTNHLVLTIDDDGYGYDTKTAATGLGCHNMVDRINTLGGSLAVTSTPGKGTNVSVLLPFHPQACQTSDGATQVDNQSETLFP
jgi:signal transduction histidine kinase